MPSDTHEPNAGDAKPDATMLSVAPQDFAQTEERLASDNPDPNTEPTAEEIAEDVRQDDIDSGARDDLDEAVNDPSVYWPSNDANSPDYNHLREASADTAFDVTPEDLETLFGANRFVPVGTSNIIAFAIRGAVLKSPHEAVRQTSIPIRDVRPTHKDYRCLIGFYYRDDGRMTLFSGSTVPCPYYMREYYNRKNGLPYSYRYGCNMLPTGCYVFRVASHGGGSIKPALRMSEPDNLSRDARVTVLRTENDKAYGNQDIWDNSRPYDNVHCSYVLYSNNRYEAPFSSAGCLTVRGRKTPSHQWKKFQDVLDGVGSGKRMDLALLTGKDVAIAAKLRADGASDSDVAKALDRLRPGSQGDEVKRLQRALGLNETGYFGRFTKERLSEYQKSKGIAADGIYSPALDADLNWQVFQQAGI